MKILRKELKKLILKEIETVRKASDNPLVGKPDTLSPQGHFNYGSFNMGLRNKELEPKPEDVALDTRYKELSKRMNFRPWTDEEGSTIKVDDGYGKTTSLKYAWTYPQYSPMKTQAIKIALKMKVRQRVSKDINFHTGFIPDPMET